MTHEELSSGKYSFSTVFNTSENGYPCEGLSARISLETYLGAFSQCESFPSSFEEVERTVLASEPSGRGWTTWVFLVNIRR